MNKAKLQRNASQFNTKVAIHSRNFYIFQMLIEIL